MKILIIYPHGLGDCILATPGLREYKKKTGNFIGFAMMNRLKSSKLFYNNPYIDELLYTKDMWNDFPNVHVGKAAVIQECKQKAKLKGYDKVIYIEHPAPKNKILIVAEKLGIELENYHTEVYITDKDYELAQTITKDRIKYGFVHSKSPSKVTPPKNLPEEYGANWLLKNTNAQSIVEVEKTYCAEDYNINVQFAIMKSAESVALIDSVFYHAAGAMDKKIDFCYFGPRKNVYERVKPLHNVEQNIIFTRIA